MPKVRNLGYGEHKATVSVTLTPTAIERLDQQAAVMGISRSELIERLARGLGELNSPKAAPALT